MKFLLDDGFDTPLSRSYLLDPCERGCFWCTPRFTSRADLVELVAWWIPK